MVDDLNGCCFVKLKVTGVVVKGCLKDTERFVQFPDPFNVGVVLKGRPQEAIAIVWL